MHDSKKISETIFSLEEIQQAGMTLAEAARSLHLKEMVPFDDIWPAVMQLRQLSEKEAMRLTKEWCVFMQD